MKHLGLYSASTDVATKAQIDAKQDILTTGSVALSLLAQGGATTGQVVTWNGTAWAPAAGGGGGGTAGKHMIPVTAGSMGPSQTGGCSPLATIASAANQPDIVSLNFSQTTQQFAQFAIPLPKRWDRGTITARFRWSHPATTTNFGVVWSLQAVAVSDNEAIAVAYGTAQQIADTGGTTSRLYVTSETPAITVGGSPADGDTIFFRVARVPADASDTMAVAGRLHGLDLFITTNAENDA
ncbi:hypothetical protein LJR066_002862 [Acidovorax sp. LjRoot66]